MEDLTTSELKELASDAAEALEFCTLGCGYQANSAKEATELTSTLVVDADFKWLMNWVNSRAKGSAYKVHEPKFQYQYPSTQQVF